MRPRQFGPRNRMPPRRASSSASASRASPAEPASRKPAEMTIAAPTPDLPHWRSTLGTVRAGVAMTASSTGWGRASTLGNASHPSMEWCRELTGKTQPWAVRRFCQSACPTLPGLSEAPITTILFGAKRPFSVLPSGASVLEPVALIREGRICGPGRALSRHGSPVAMNKPGAPVALKIPRDGFLPRAFLRWP